MKTIIAGSRDVTEEKSKRDTSSDWDNHHTPMYTTIQEYPKEMTHRITNSVPGLLSERIREAILTKDGFVWNCYTNDWQPIHYEPGGQPNVYISTGGHKWYINLRRALVDRWSSRKIGQVYTHPINHDNHNNHVDNLYCSSSTLNSLGLTYNRLTVLEVLTYNGVSSIIARCSCGEVIIRRSAMITCGCIKSCGCFHEESRKYNNRTHGMHDTRLNSIWRGIKGRCNNQKDKAYHNYGGRGITVCKEWQDDFMTFYNWSMDNGYTKDLSIDRRDNDGNYEPSNCRWTTMIEQGRNRRNNVKYSLDGKMLCMSQISEYTGIRHDTLHYHHKRYGNIDKIYEKHGFSK